MKSLLYATVLHLLGLDNQQLVYARNGLEERLTGVSEILA